MTAAGLGLNKFCYAGLIVAQKNKLPRADDTAAKVIYLIFGWLFVFFLKEFFYIT